MSIKTGYLVLTCGCTDCFPAAMFFDRGEADSWARDNAFNPEGYVIKEIDVSSLNISDD